MDAVTPIPERTLQLVGQIIEIARSDGARPGDRLFEHRLAQRLGVSRGPVRAALQVLAEAGLAGTIPNRGYVRRW
jgi:DNA-binding GntR family transcriptional regulator